jgi:glutamate 5-kinase
VIVVVKVGTSSLTDEHGTIDAASIGRLADDVAEAAATGHEVVLVTSGAIAAGLPALGLSRRPTVIGVLQAVAAVGQPLLMNQWRQALAERGLVAGQVLMTPYDFLHRSQYLHARETLRRLLDLRVVPVVNENDTLADDEIRFGDNDRLAALVAHLVSAELLLLLTDQAGLYTADPRRDPDARLIEVVPDLEAELDHIVGGAGTERGSGGMSSKLTAARIAAWSGVRAVIAAAARPGALAAAIAGEPVGTTVLPRARRLASRKLWIAFAQPPRGRIVVDAGARTALVEGGRSLLAAGVREVAGDFEVEDPVEIAEATSGRPFARGLARYDATRLRLVAGRRTADLPDGVPHEVVHRDDLVVLP